MTAPREIFDCERVRAFLESYLEGQVPPPERRAMRLHIHACEACRSRVIARDPLQMFAPLADEERPDEFWAGFWPAVRADIHAAEAEARSWRARLLRPAIAWSAAAALLVVAAVAVVRPWRATPASRDFREAAAPDWRRVLPSAGQPGEPVPATLEDVRSPSARVLTMKVYGRDEAVTEVVLIVDEGINL
ncbi:MAG: zf-HC2 domain-containing protein [Acidobacteria bacterium]|nr:zf-HC2 domain-containing protein [Acidobacteriota bacterium]